MCSTGQTVRTQLVITAIHMGVPALVRFFLLLSLPCLPWLEAEACWCKGTGRFCGDQLDQCLPHIVYECERAGREPRQIANCDTGCTMSSGIASCWQKATATIRVN